MQAVYDYPFSETDAAKAYEEWGANCGPNALAFATRRHIEDVRQLIPDFDKRRYTSPTMMKAALEAMDVAYKPYAYPRLVSSMFAANIALTRIQWCGPWTAQGANPKWAYRQTHWIASWAMGDVNMVFDCNGGIMAFRRWETDVVPAIVSTIPRADGKWFPTHVWRIV